MHHLTAIDWLVIVGYLIGITFVGFYASYRTKSSASFFISDRKYGRLLLFFLTMGSSSHADQAATVAAKTYKVGASGIWWQWLYLFSTPFYWLLVPAVRRMRAVTVSDFFEQRYSRGVSSLYAVFGIVQMVVAIGLMLKTSGVTIEAVSAGQITQFYAVLIMTVLFVAYGIVGGLNSSIYTDVVQGTLMIVLSCLIFPFALSKMGGMAGLRHIINSPDMFRLANSQITVFYIAVLSFNGLMGYFGQPNCMLTSAGKTDFECRMGFVSGLLIKRLLTIAWTLTGLCGLAFYAGRTIEIDQVYGLIARDLLPQIGSGLLGLFIAAMLASMMGACNALMVTGSALLVENLYRPFLGTKKSDRHFMRMGQLAAVMIVVLAILFAYQLESLVAGLETFMEAAAVIGITVWIGLIWRKATVAGAWAGIIAGATVWLFMKPISFSGFSWDFNQSFAASLPSWMLSEGKLYPPWHMLCYLGTNLVVTVLVSLFTKPVAKERLDRFYECIRTPVTDAEPETAPFTLPPGVKPAPRRVLIQHPDFEIPVPSRSSVVGFVVNCALVAAIIVGGYWVFSLGQ